VSEAKAERVNRYLRQLTKGHVSVHVLNKGDLDITQVQGNRNSYRFQIGSILGSHRYRWLISECRGTLASNA